MERLQALFELRWLPKQRSVDTDLLSALGLDKSNLLRILQRLSAKRIKFWQDLLGLQSRQLVCEILGKELINDAIILWTKIHQYKQDIENNRAFGQKSSPKYGKFRDMRRL